MKPSEFYTAKIKRALAQSGVKYTFTRAGDNKFGEATGEPTTVKELMGIYHEQSGYIALATTDGSKVQSKKTPMVLCLLEDTTLLKVDDLVTIGGRVYKVTGVLDVNNFGSVGDISLELTV